MSELDGHQSFELTEDSFVAGMLKVLAKSPFLAIWQDKLHSECFSFLNGPLDREVLHKIIVVQMISLTGNPTNSMMLYQYQMELS
jgi:hypothetical protein